jgi:hypothetical protein
MNHSSDRGTRRTSSFDARNFLSNQGYTVFRIGDPKSPFHLVAWKDHNPLLIRVLSSRQAIFLKDLAHETRLLVPVVKSHNFPGDVQIWIRSDQLWYRYEVLPGGTISLGEQP